MPTVLQSTPHRLLPNSFQMGCPGNVPLWNQLATLRQGAPEPIGRPSPGSWLGWMTCGWWRDTD